MAHQYLVINLWVAVQHFPELVAKLGQSRAEGDVEGLADMKIIQQARQSRIRE